jgi:hypothetical protein
VSGRRVRDELAVHGQERTLIRVELGLLRVRNRLEVGGAVALSSLMTATVILQPLSRVQAGNANVNLLSTIRISTLSVNRRDLPVVIASRSIVSHLCSGTILGLKLAGYHHRAVNRDRRVGELLFERISIIVATCDQSRPTAQVGEYYRAATDAALVIEAVQCLLDENPAVVEELLTGDTHGGLLEFSVSDKHADGRARVLGHLRAWADHREV